MKKDYPITNMYLNMMGLFRTELLYKILEEAFTFIDISFDFSNHIFQNHLIPEIK